MLVGRGVEVSWRGGQGPDPTAPKGKAKELPLCSNSDEEPLVGFEQGNILSDLFSERPVVWRTDCYREQAGKQRDQVGTIQIRAAGALD